MCLLHGRLLALISVGVAHSSALRSCMGVCVCVLSCCQAILTCVVVVGIEKQRRKALDMEDKCTAGSA